MSQAGALKAFADFAGKTESAEHIKPLHWYVACRLVVEGGFAPEDVTPHPPLRVEQKKKDLILHYDESVAGSGELTVLGGLKTKNVDVVVTRKGIGPVVAVSCKGVTKAFRNLTNRMEETIGECTNLHITYPALVLGYLVLLRANRLVEKALEDAEAIIADEGGADELTPAKELEANDIAIDEGGEPVAGIVRFHNALRELVARRGIRNDVSRYEAIGVALVDVDEGGGSGLFEPYPPAASPLHLSKFFDTLYLRYDERFVVSAPDLKRVTKRRAWQAQSPAFTQLVGLDYTARIAE